MRTGHDRRDETRGNDRRDSFDIFTVSRMVGENAERISALLTFPPMMLACDADANRANAAQLVEANSFLLSLLS